MSSSDTDTICAVCATGTIGIIRISGGGAFNACRRFFSGKVPFESHRVYYGKITDGETDIDEVLVLPMKAPRSYTMEDVIEIHCHGGVKTLEMIMQLLIDSGIRPAEPGEFTKRAFLNGRIDLSQAEAVSDLIAAKSTLAAQEALARLSGRLKSKITKLRAEILGILAAIEASIDYPEHGDFEPSGFDGIIFELETLLANSSSAELVKNGVDTVILGLPNVGKSSLIYLLLGEERAIVTDIPGTTRDLVCGHIVFGGVPLSLTDTAGIRSSSDKIEEIGVERSLAAAKSADLIFLVLDGSRELTEQDKELLTLTADKNVITIINKSDLPRLAAPSADAIELSTVTGAGLSALKEAVTARFTSLLTDRGEALSAGSRQHAAIYAALASMTNAAQTLQNNLGADFVSIDLLDAYRKLGEVVGETYDDDVIDAIFSKFCLGK